METSNWRLVTHDDDPDGEPWIGLHEIEYRDGEPVGYVAEPAFCFTVEQSQATIVEFLDTVTRDVRAQKDLLRSSELLNSMRNPARAGDVPLPETE